MKDLSNEYPPITDDDFDRILGDIVSALENSSAMDIPGVYEIVSKYFNNEEEQEDAINMTYEEAVDSFTENILPIVIKQYNPNNTIPQQKTFNN